MLKNDRARRQITAEYTRGRIELDVASVNMIIAPTSELKPKADAAAICAAEGAFERFKGTYPC